MEFVVFDIDDVLCPCIAPLFDWHNKNYGTKLTYSDCVDYNLWNVWGGTQEEAVRKIMEFYKSDHFKNIKPFKEAYPVLKALKQKGYTPVAMTSRPDTIENSTRSFLYSGFPNIFKEEYVFFTNHFSGNGRRVTKGQASIEYLSQQGKILYAVEDGPVHAASFCESGIFVHLKHAPWNINLNIEGLNRIHTLESVLEK